MGQSKKEFTQNIMSYLVLARKYRPEVFDEVVGQEHITNLLEKSIQSDRLAHAYLFCGPRGIGKTSCARILAKSLNCEQAPTLKPCGQCPACQEITKGTSFDVLEIDGASNRGIDEVRTLRENVKFVPGYGHYKIYIIDEVHMLTGEAFNALLKTLEEPPAHVKFIFATTEPNKVPATIISRCQRFDFKRVAMKTIVNLLARISEREQFNIDQEALYAIAKSAQGSLRDGLSILDQLSALSEEGIASSDVFSMLGLVETQFLFDLADALSQKSCLKSLEALEKIIDKGKDIKQLAKDITEHFRHLMVIKVGGKSLGRLVDYPIAVKEMLLTQSECFSLQDILKAIDQFIEAQETARITESIRMSLEIAFAKLTYRGEDDQSNSPMGDRQVLCNVPTVKGQGSPVSILGNKKGQVDISGSNSPADKSKSNSEGEDVVDHLEGIDKEEGAGGVIDIAKIKRMWDALTPAVSREKMSTATYLQEGSAYQFSGNTLTIAFPSMCNFQKETLEDAAHCKLVERVFSEKLENSIVVKYTIAEQCEPGEEAENIKNALATFQGAVVNRWHDDS